MGNTVATKAVVAPYTYSPYVYGNTHIIAKREAEAEADPAVFYRNFYNRPAYTGYTGYTHGLTYAYNPVYGYNRYNLGYNGLYYLIHQKYICVLLLTMKKF